MTAEPVVWERIRRDRCEALEAVARAAKAYVREVNEGTDDLAELDARNGLIAALKQLANCGG